MTFRSSTPSISAKVLTKFPTRIVGGTGLAIDKANGIWSVALDIPSLDELAVPDLNTSYVIVYDAQSDSYMRSTVDVFASLVAETHTHPWSQITDTPTTLSGYGITDGQPLDVDLTAIAALSSAADTVPYATGAGTWALATLTSAGRDLIDDATTSDMLTTLGIPASALYGPGPHIILEDQKSSGTAGGTFTSGADQTRTLNTEVYDPNNWCTLASNQFTLPAGTWFVRWQAPAFATFEHQSMLYNVTDSAVVSRGSSAFAGTGTSACSTDSHGSCVVTIAASKAFTIRHQADTTKSTDGFGVPANFGTEIYTQVEITRVA